MKAPYKKLDRKTFLAYQKYGKIIGQINGIVMRIRMYRGHYRVSCFDPEGNVLKVYTYRNMEPCVAKARNYATKTIKYTKCPLQGTMFGKYVYIKAHEYEYLLTIIPDVALGASLRKKLHYHFNDIMTNKHRTQEPLAITNHLNKKYKGEEKCQST